VTVSARFHRGLADGIGVLAEAHGAEHVVLAGGCFANRRLLELSIEGLSAAGRSVDWPRLLPPGDGGLALGQLAAAARREC
jgi:hydrogenase maturation protein HypF